jgi:hypothetical protein
MCIHSFLPETAQVVQQNQRFTGNRQMRPLISGSTYFPLRDRGQCDIVIALSSFANNGLGRGVAMKKILVIEDEDSLRLAIMAVLRK